MTNSTVSSVCCAGQPETVYTPLRLETVSWRHGARAVERTGFWT